MKMYKEEAEIVLYNIFYLEKGISPEMHSIEDFDNLTFYSIHGEFFYCGLLLSGELILTSEQFLSIQNEIKFLLKQAENEEFTISELSSTQKNDLRAISIFAKCKGDELVEAEDDENYIFILKTLNLI